MSDDEVGSGPVSRAIKELVDFTSYRTCPRYPGVEIDREHHKARWLIHRIMAGQQTCLQYEAAAEIDAERARQHQEWLKAQYRYNHPPAPPRRQEESIEAHNEEHYHQYFPNVPYHTL